MQGVMFHCFAVMKRVWALDNLNCFLEPGMLVKHPSRPDWGVGQVQSRINERITVNFSEVGKIVIDGSHIILVQVTSTGK